MVYPAAGHGVLTLKIKLKMKFFIKYFSFFAVLI